VALCARRRAPPRCMLARRRPPKAACSHGGGLPRCLLARRRPTPFAPLRRAHCRCVLAQRRPRSAPMRQDITRRALPVMASQREKERVWVLQNLREDKAVGMSGCHGSYKDTMTFPQSYPPHREGTVRRRSVSFPKKKIQSKSAYVWRHCFACTCTHTSLMKRKALVALTQSRSHQPTDASSSPLFTSFTFGKLLCSPRESRAAQPLG
jgi:hypothetical protein